MVKLRLNDLKLIAANKNKNEAKFKFQGLSEISQRWFDIEFDFIEISFSTREPDFHENIFQGMAIHKTQIRLKAFNLQ